MQEPSHNLAHEDKNESVFFFYSNKHNQFTSVQIKCTVTLVTTVAPGYSIPVFSFHKALCTAVAMTPKLKPQLPMLPKKSSTKKLFVQRSCIIAVKKIPH